MTVVAWRGRMVDWPLAQRLYASPSMSAREIARIIGVAPSSVVRRAAREGWTRPEVASVGLRCALCGRLVKGARTAADIESHQLFGHLGGRRDDEELYGCRVCALCGEVLWAARTATDVVAHQRSQACAWRSLQPIDDELLTEEAVPTAARISRLRW